MVCGSGVERLRRLSVDASGELGGGRAAGFGIAQFIERGEKFGKRNADTFGIANYGVAFGPEGGDGERHGDAVIALRVDFGAA